MRFSPPTSSFRASAILVLLGTVLACSGSAGDMERSEALSPPSLEAAFGGADTLVLEEVPGDTIADIGAVEVLPDGRLLIADRLLPRVRLYDRDGRFLAGQGRFGDGPHEYRQILDLAADHSGRVFVVGFRHPHLTVLTPELTPDTLLGLPGEAVVSNLIGRFGDGVVLSGAQTGGTRLHFMNGVGSARWAVEPGPQEIFEKPYWASVTGFFVEASGEHLFVANSILYPIMILDGNGDRAGEIGTPPPSFRPVPELELGALAHTGTMDGNTQNRLEQWLESFTVITGIHVIRDRWLVVVHGRIGTNPPFPPFRRHDLTLDLYDLPTGEKLQEDVPLPEGARVLGGGGHLHVQVSQPPDRWTIVRFDVSGS